MQFLQTKFTSAMVFALRVLLGWLMFYAGIVKILDPNWSAAGYLTKATTFHALYNWFASASLLPIINLINEWGLLLLGVSLILGAFVRLSSVLGCVLMLLYYFPILTFPYIASGFLVDQHIIYAAILLVFAALGAGRFWGVDAYLVKRFPQLKKVS